MPNGFEHLDEEESPPDNRGQGGDPPPKEQLPSNPAELQEMLDDILDIALDENGYSELLDWTQEQVATDLCDYCPDLEGQDTERLLPHIKDWQERRKRARSRT
jgi:hypothetical protein